VDFVNPVSNYLQGLTLRTFADWQVTGKDNVPPRGPLIVVANHQSNFDPPLLCASLPRRVSFLAKKSLFKSAIPSWFLRSYGAYPVDRGGADIGAYRWALRQLDAGQMIVIFPEGTRTRGGMRKAHPGVARLALSTGVSLLPVGMTGTERLGTVLRVFNPTGKIRVNIGPPFAVPNIDGRPGPDVLKSITDMIMQRVAAQLPREYRGVYQITGKTGSDRSGAPGQGVDSPGLPLA
jgi:1-acyl-sn-glycerol-3-phosphate acyltransferase